MGEHGANAVSGPTRALLSAIFFASGAASLILQVVWLKQLQFVLGSATFSVSVTVASFFFGLSVGSAIGGRIADHVARPLRVYGCLELCLALVSFLVTVTLAHWPVWAVWISPMLDSPARLPLIVVVSLVTLSLPTMLMGATLPFLVKFLVRSRTELARQVGHLYGFNTLGAAFGTLGAGFVFIGLSGVTGSSLIASTVYACVGLCALIAARHERPLPAIKPEEARATNATTEVTNPEFLIWCFAVSGFVSIAYEVVWFRFLTNISTSSVYAFSGMLGTYLFGLVIGALVCARFLSPRKDQLLRTFALTQILIAVAASVTLATLGKAGTLHAFLSPVVADLVPSRAEALLGDDVSFFVTCVLAMLLPATLIGISFPLATELTFSRMGALGRRIGTLYSLNTIGGVLGSLAAGFLLIPYLGSQWTLVTLVLTNILLFVAIMLSQRGLPMAGILWRQGAMAATVVIVSFMLLGPHYLDRQLTAFRGASVLAFRESKEATYVVLGYRDAAAGKFEQLVVNSKSYANNRPEGRRYMAAMGHFPLLFHQGPSRTAVVICIGTGTTIGAVSTHKELQSITAVDLAPAVFQFAPYFVPVNHRFFENPMVHQVVADGRNYLLATTNSFDVITLEPPPPHDAGIVNLYTEEFYALAKQRLRPGGVLAQWVPLDMPRSALPKLILKALLAQFKHVSLWVPSRMEGVAIASDEPLKFDRGTLATRMSAPLVAQDLDAVGLRSPEDILATFVAADGALNGFVRDVPSLTDDRPRLEYFNFYPAGPIQVSELKKLRQPVERYLTADAAEGARLDAARAVVNAIWDEHDATVRGDAAAARSALNAALKLEPNNLYLGFLERKERAAAASAKVSELVRKQI